ncbi:MAG TPA: FecR domain-containing protein [Pyrinomonadaceae bacterium]
MLNISRRICFFGWLAAIFVFAASETVQAQATFEARVTSVVGNATLSGNGRNGAKLSRGVNLSPGDEIDTRRGGRVVIDLSDGSQVVVLPGSRLIIGDYQNANSLRELLQIILGRIRVKINHFKNQPNPYRIKSPTASISVRGTEFEVMVASLGETRVVVLSGAVEVASLKDPKHSLIAEPGRGVIVQPNYSLEFFVSEILTKETGEREKPKDSDDRNRRDTDNEINSVSASSIYERSIESIVESGETALPSRFTAFPDPYLDSFDNPAYAADFTTAEGRIYFIPSLNGVSAGDENIRDRFGLSDPRKVDYGFVPDGSIFVPLKRFRSVVGGNFGYVRNGLQSLTANEDFPLTNPPFPVGTTGIRTETGLTTGNIFNGSLMFARRFGSRDQTSVGFSIERLISRGSLNETIVQRDAGGFTWNEQSAARSSVNRTRFTFGIKHDFGNFKFGAFYRYSMSAGSDTDRFRLVNGIAQTKDFIKSKGNSSELGFRLRGAFSHRLFYGAEGTILFGQSRENLQRAVIVDSKERSATNRYTLGFGLGYVLRPRTIFSFDAAGGLIKTDRRRTENFTANLLETESQRARFLSLYAAVQTSVWRNLFVSASILSLTQSRTNKTALFPDRFGRILNSDGVFTANEHTKDFFTDFFSNYGIGWRFKSGLVLEYILTTDYGQTAPRHAFLLRYNFDFSHK